jgi:hypothetical protein
MAELSAKGPLFSSHYFLRTTQGGRAAVLVACYSDNRHGFSAVATVMTWFWTKLPDPPTASATNVLVTQRSGSVVCGKLASEKGVLLAKNKQGGTLTVLNDVAASNVVSACP